MTFDNRVVASLQFEFFLLLLISFFVNKPILNNYLISTFAILILIFSSLAITNSIHKKTSYSINTILPFLKNNYVIVSKSNNFLAKLPLDSDFQQIFSTIKFYYIGWNLGSPDSIKLLDGSNNFYELIINKPNVILYTDKHRLNVIKKFFLEHYNKKVEFKEIKENYYKVYTFNL
jgi:hypothetical protein